MKNRNNTFFLCVLLSLLMSASLTAQVSLRGQVVSEEEILSFATVSIEELNRGTTTDIDGYYEFNNLDAGTYQITVSFLGYESLTKTLSLTEAITVLDFNLQAAVNQMEEIVVTGTMKPTYVSDSPIKVDVISAKKLETFLPSASASLMDNIQLVNGVQEVVACGVCFTNSISINGLPGPYTAILMDGTPIYGSLASVYGLNGIPNMIIDRFEVIKGPSSTLYGSEAVAGVINIITKDPKTQPLLAIDIMGTTRLESFGNLAFAPSIGKSTGYVGLNYSYINNFQDINNDGFGDGVNMDRYSLFTKWDIHRKSGKPFTIAAKYYYEDRRNGVEEFLVNRNYRTLRGDDQIYGESIYTNRAELFGTYVFNTKPSLKLDFSLSHHDQDSYYGSDYYQASQQIAFGNLLWNITSFKKHDILLGLTARYNAYDDNSVATETIINNETINQADHQFIPGVFVQDEFIVHPKLTLLGGLRLDHYERHGLIPAPRLNVKYKPSDWTTIRANFGTGFRVVNLFTEDHAFVTGQRTVEIVETLEPESSYNASLNINQVYGAFGGSGTIDIEGYFTHFTNKIIPNYDNPTQIIYANSDGFARTKGLGITINHNFSFPLSFNIGMNVQAVTETEPNDNGIEETRAIEFAPKWSGVFTTNYTWKKPQLTFGYTIQATGPMALPEVFDLDENGLPLSTPRPTVSTPFYLHDLQISKTFNQQFSMYTGIQNLTNFRQLSSPLVGYNDPNAPLGFSDYFDTSYAYAPNHGIEFYLGIKWHLSNN